MTTYRVEEHGGTEVLVDYAPMESALMRVECLCAAQASRDELRAAIRGLEVELLQLPQVEQPLFHDFVDGLYKRTRINPQGSLLVTQIHREPNFSFLMRGAMRILTEEGRVLTLQAPAHFPTQPGTKRVIIALEDCEFITIHPNPLNLQDVQTLEDRIATNSFDDLEILASAGREPGVLS